MSVIEESPVRAAQLRRKTCPKWICRVRNNVIVSNSSRYSLWMLFQTAWKRRPEPKNQCIHVSAWWCSITKTNTVERKQIKPPVVDLRLLWVWQLKDGEDPERVEIWRDLGQDQLEQVIPTPARCCDLTGDLPGRGGFLQNQRLGRTSSVQAEREQHVPISSYSRCERTKRGGQNGRNNTCQFMESVGEQKFIWISRVLVHQRK